MDISTILFCLVVALIITTVLQRLYDVNQKRPPGPIGLPFMGRLPFILFKNVFFHHGNLFNALSSEGSSYGDARFLRVGTRHVVILSSFDSISEALTRQSEDFLSRPCLDYFFSHRLVDVHQDKSMKLIGGLVYSNEPIWRENRRFALRVLREFGMGKNMVEAKVQIECRSLVDEVKKSAASPVNPNMYLTKAVSNVISQVVFGHRLGYEDPEFEYQVTLMKMMVQSYGFSLFLPVFYPFLENKTYYKLANAQRFSDLDDKLMAYILRKSGEVERKYNLSDEPSNFIEAFIKKSIEEKNKDSSKSALFSHQQLKVAVADLFLAGTDTTSNAINWALICAAYHPEWQQQIQDEFDEQLGSCNDIKYADRLRCPRTQAFLDEVMRFCSVVPHNIERESDREIWFRNGRISPKTYIIADIRSVHRSPELWKDPDVFRPTRFLNDKNEYRPSNHLISFSVGKRVCLGEGMARVEYFLFFATLIHHFYIKMDEDAKRKGESIFHGTDGIVNAPKKHKLIFTERH